ncbi:PIN domain-containing protein [Salinibacter grassmerensis]|uniref:PIN domain-containing protein n=1 Tax=Salinibacter grassmerensis TaxID=3040353 RepID=UPI0021E7DA48|nr:PIN domain-containing protein [Salinibacter grassmerensis]
MSTGSDTYVLDTNVFVGYVRDTSYSRHIDQQHAPLERNNIALVSAVTKGELHSLAYQFDWGTRKKEELQYKLDSVSVVPLQSGDLIGHYAEIDAYSQNALPGREMDESDRNMGKNDVWIAATASVVGATLITTDDDFDHLDGEFLNRIYVDPDAEYDL